MYIGLADVAAFGALMTGFIVKKQVLYIFKLNIICATYEIKV